MSNKWKMPIEGWIVGKLSRQPAFSDGHAMFIGEPKGKTRTLKTKVKDPFRYAARQVVLKNGNPIGEIAMRTTIGPEPYHTRVVKLAERTIIQEVFYDYAVTHFKYIKFFAGRKGREGFPLCVTCKVGKKLVGVIMTVRA